jgi:hypothetical protein
MSQYVMRRLSSYTACCDGYLFTTGYENGHQDATTSEPKSTKVNTAKLTKVIQAGQFLLQFATWQQKLQKRLHVATSVDSTLAALQVWSSFHFYDESRVAIVSYVVKRLKRLVKQQSSQQHTDAQVLKQWSTALHMAAQDATHKLKQVHAMLLVIHTDTADASTATIAANAVASVESTLIASRAHSTCCRCCTCVLHSMASSLLVHTSGMNSLTIHYMYCTVAGCSYSTAA